MRRVDSRRRGFTLLEILLVMVLVVGLATVTFVLVSGRAEEGNIDNTKIRLQKVLNALEEYKLKLKYGYPTEEQGLKALVEKPVVEDETGGGNWTRPFRTEEDLKDAWGRELMYKLEETQTEETTRMKPLIWSKGPNGQDDNGTGDDIKSKNWPKEDV